MVKHATEARTESLEEELLQGLSPATKDIVLRLCAGLRQRYVHTGVH